MSTQPDTDLHAAFSSLEKKGFTPKVQCVELLDRYPVPGSTKNTHLRHIFTLLWEHSRGTFDSDCIEQFFVGEHRSAVRAALMNGDFELGHPVTETASSSRRMVMNAQGAYERL